VNFQDLKVAWSSQGSPALTHETTVTVAPLGIDADFWHRNSGNSSIAIERGLPDTYALSVERADYTKGVLERLNGVDLYFQRNPDEAGKMTFVQICTPTRTGLSGYDEYWRNCTLRAEALNRRWAEPGWQPLIWFTEAVPATELSSLYSRARLAVVSPLCDGLNLTAKEFVASQQAQPGALLLSRGAGVWHELSEYALSLDPESPDAVARELEIGLSLGESEREFRIRQMQSLVRANSLDRWWSLMTNSACPAARADVLAAGMLT
jgi:trehalose 6-phosphate synthase